MSSNWDNTAKQLGLAVVERGGVLSGPKKLELEGGFEGCAVQVVYEVVHDDGGRKTRTYYSVGSEKNPDRHPVALVRPRIVKRVWSQSFRSGDREWDRRFVVRSDDHDAAVLFLTAERRAIFEEAHYRLPYKWTFGRGFFKASRVYRDSGEDVAKTVRTLAWLANGVSKGSLDPNSSSTDAQLSADGLWGRRLGYGEEQQPMSKSEKVGAALFGIIAVVLLVVAFVAT